HVGTSLALLILSAMSGSLRLYDDEFEFSLLAKDLIDKYLTPSDGFVLFTYGIIIHYKYYPMKDCIEPLYNNFLNSMDVGKWETAIISLHQAINMMVCAGMPLKVIIKKIEYQYSYVKEIKELDEILCFRSIYQHLNYLNGTLADNPQVIEQILPEEYESLDKNKSPKTIYIYNMYSLMNSFIFGKYEAAYRSSEILEELYNEKFAEGMFFWMIFFLFRPLALIHILPFAKLEEREYLKQQLAVSYKRLKLFSKHYPANTYNKYLLVKAELAASESNTIGVLELYEEAIATSKEKELFHELALANELAANFLLKINRKRAAYGYLREAYYYYEQWGAKAKVHQLIKTYPKVFSELQNISSDEHYSPSLSMTSESFIPLSNKVDIDALLKASQIIAGEIRIEYLIDKILKVIVQSSCAEKVVLLLTKGKELFVNGYFSNRDLEQRKEFNENSLQNYNTVDYLPHQVIDFVYNKKEYLIEYDISSNETFMNDHYIKREGTHSVLCYPLQKSGSITGVLYLENNLAKGAFTNKHLSVLDVLSGEIATMLEIANSYRAFERFVPKEFLIPLGKEKITDVSIGDHKEINISILFSDIRSFTGIAEHLTSKETFDLLNRLFGLFNPIVIKNKGFIDKYIGDAIMALFPVTADDALESAVEMQSIVRRFQQEIVENTGVTIQIGIGLNIGPAILGVLGSLDHMNTTVVSDAVNISSRLESLTKVYGAQILLSESFHQSLNFPDSYMISFVDTVILKGKSGSTKIFEVFPAEICSAQLFNQCEQEYLIAWEKYAQGDFIEAHKGFSALLKSHPNKIRVKLFIERCYEFIHHGMKGE
nr:hypothetical protein [Nitrosopumilus sp.]